MFRQQTGILTEDAKEAISNVAIDDKNQNIVENA